MRMAGCCCEAPTHASTTLGMERRYLSARLYPRAMGMVLGVKHEGVQCVKKWPRQLVVPAVPEEWLPWRHPILGDLRLLAVVLELPPNAVRCTMTRCSRSPTRRALAHGR
jgi:hypothetical protein